jgi:hypothetical protein
LRIDVFAEWAQINLIEQIGNSRDFAYKFLFGGAGGHKVGYGPWIVDVKKSLTKSVLKAQIEILEFVDEPICHIIGDILYFWSIFDLLTPTFSGTREAILGIKVVRFNVT